MEGFSIDDQSITLVETLTRREQDVLTLLAKGLSNREIATALTIEPASVKWYTKQIYGKLGVHNREDAVTRARALGLITGDVGDIGQTPSLLPCNLPASMSTFIGRQRDIERVGKILANPAYRLITLTGAGGVGKTRLALRVAEETCARGKSRVWLIELASIASTAMLIETINVSFGLSIDKDLSPLVVLQNYLRPKNMLLILDNCEHLVQACASLAESLLKACPKLQILATSREALGINGEIPYCVPSLSLPETHMVPSLERLSEYEAVALFVERAGQGLPDFALTADNAQAIVRICQHLDGIPLALELAAARVNSLTLEQIATRLEESLSLLAGGSRTALSRHQTMQASIAWSYHLLAEPERILLQRLSVFSGTWSLQAAEQVCSDEALPATEIFDLLTKLIQKSLVQVERLPGAQIRYSLLEMVRQFASMELNVSGQGDVWHDHHGLWYMQFAKTAEEKLEGGEQLAWQKKIAEDYDNLRAALHWNLTGNNQPEISARMAIALSTYWKRNNYRVEGCRWTKMSLDRLERQKSTDLAPEWIILRVKLWRSLATLDVTASPMVRISWLENALDICGLLGEGGNLERAAISSLRAAIEAFDLGNLHRGLALLSESEAMSRSLGDQGKLCLSIVLARKSSALSLLNEHASALDCVHESVTLCREKGDIWATRELVLLGDRAIRQNRYELARRYYEQALNVSRESRNKEQIASHYKKLGDLEKVLGKHKRAFALYDETLAFYAEMGWLAWPRSFAWLLESIALNEIFWANQPGQPFAREHCLRAACILGAERALLEKIGLPVFVEKRQEYDQAMGILREQIDLVTLENVQAEGRAMSMEELVKFIGVLPEDLDFD